MSPRTSLSLLAILLAMGGCAGTPGKQGTAALLEQMQAPALPARPAPAAPAATEPARPPVAPAPPEQPRFNLTVNNARAAEVFLGMVSGTPYSILVHPDVTGTLTLNLKGVTVPEALEAIRRLYGYEYEIHGRQIVIPSPAPQTRVFQVNALAMQRRGASDMRVVSGSISLSGGGAAGGGSASAGALQTSSVQTQNESKYWEELTTALQAIVGEQGQVVVSPQSGLVIVRAAPRLIGDIERYLRATEAIGARQVMLEAKILEVQLYDEYQSGINWADLSFNGKARIGQAGIDSAGSVNLGGPIATMLGGAIPGASGALFGAAFVEGGFGAIINLLERQGVVHVLSSPRIATLNNQKAVLKVGRDDYFVTGITGGTVPTSTTPATPPNVEVQPFFSGIALDVTPQIDDKDNITLHVRPSISVVREEAKRIDLGNLGQFRLPFASSSVTETDSVVRLKDGQIVAIGGLMKQDYADATRRIPGLGGMPLVGELFGGTLRTSEKRELVVLIRPTILREEADWQRDYAALRERLQSYRLPRRTPDALDGERSGNGESR